MADFRQEDFSAGMNLFDHAALLPANQYGLAYNVRNRENGLKGILGKIEDDDIPAGKKQGLYAFDQLLVAFVNGYAYYKNVVTNTDWEQIEEFVMSPTADYIYAEAVPASQSNLERKLTTTNVEGGVTVTNLRISDTPACLVCGDGSNKEMLIFSDGSCRAAQTYAEWTIVRTEGNYGREYVPVMKQRKYVDGILFGIGTDGQLLRSVTGRPLDFVVNITTTGDKGGDAYTTAYRPTYDEITFLGALNSQKLIVSTKLRSYPLGIDRNNSQFGEPKFTNNEAFDAGVVNQFSFLPILRPDGFNDYLFVDYDGLRSYIATLQDQNEGRNSSFTRNITGALSSPQVADETAAIVFDNYSMFAIKTRYGNLTAVFDNLRQQWVGFDNNEITIKQFAVANKTTAPQLYAISDTKLYRLLAAEDYLVSQVDLRAINSGSARVQLKLEDFYLVLDGSSDAGDVTITDIVDGTIDATIVNEVTSDEVDILRYNFSGSSKLGWKIQPRISWADGSHLLLAEATLKEDNTATPAKQKAARSIS